MDIMDKIPFRPVGERFNFGDVVLEVVADADFTYSDCPGCYFFSYLYDTLAKLRVLEVARNLSLL